MTTARLLWVDDEIELLRAHLLFLEKKGYEVTTASNAGDALDCLRAGYFDLILLDEMMPGLSGLEALPRIKELAPSTPVVMVTKSEEEDIMNQAIGQQIADYLIKPVNPTQILLTLKKNIHQREIKTEVTQTAYRQDFMELSMQIQDCRTFDDWVAVYKRLVYWELQLQDTADDTMRSLLVTQMEDANRDFGKFIAKNYERWLSSPNAVRGHEAEGRERSVSDRPVMSPDVFKHSVFPALREGGRVFLLVLDNFRYDQWLVLRQELGDLFHIDESLYCSILPTATQYARNAIFSGLMPVQIAKMFPELWVDEDEEEGKNLNEAPLIQTQMDRFRRRHTFSYHKINDSAAAEKLAVHFNELDRYELNVIVLNFIDMLSHARTEMKMVRELAGNEAAYRSITQSWFRHSAVGGLFRQIAATGAKVILTTDHGSIRVQTPVKVVGDKNTNTNLRYKLGKNLSYPQKEVFEMRDPQRFGLPSPNISTAYIYALADSFFAYPNNYNYYVSYYRDTFQHGGISMEEMLIPLITMRGKQQRSSHEPQTRAKR